MIRTAFVLSGLLLLVGCATHREPAANCWQHRVAFVAALTTQSGPTDCTFAPLPGPTGPVDV